MSISCMFHHVYCSVFYFSQPIHVVCEVQRFCYVPFYCVFFRRNFVCFFLLLSFCFFILYCCCCSYCINIKSLATKQNVKTDRKQQVFQTVETQETSWKLMENNRCSSRLYTEETQVGEQQAFESCTTQRKPKWTGWKTDIKHRFSSRAQDRGNSRNQLEN